MSRWEAVSAWEHEVSSHLPALSRMQARGLAWWSYGVVLAQRCGQSSVATALATLLGQQEGTVRQRLREWTYEASAKRGRPRRREVAVAACFTGLLRWVLSGWAAEERRLALALDATTLGTRFTVLALCVVVRGCGLPVAWVVVRANTPGAWRPHWEGLLRQMAGGVPAGWTVIVLADRGLYAGWLFQAIRALGWHPFLRLNGGKGSGLYRPVSGGPWRPLASLLMTPGDAWCGEVVCFREQTVVGTLLARWEPGYQESWLVLTDLPPAGAEVAWYALRAWVECGFKDIKRAGWQWQRTRMRDPARAARLWLVLAVATLWVVSVGSAAEAARPASTLDDLPPTHVARQTATGRPTPRLLSCFRRGLLVVVVTLAAGAVVVPLGHLLPEPWPPGACLAPG